MTTRSWAVRYSEYHAWRITLRWELQQHQFKEGIPEYTTGNESPGTSFCMLIIISTIITIAPPLPLNRIRSCNLSNWNRVKPYNCNINHHINNNYHNSYYFTPADTAYVISTRNLLFKCFLIDSNKVKGPHGMVLYASVVVANANKIIDFSWDIAIICHL